MFFSQTQVEGHVCFAVLQIPANVRMGVLAKGKDKRDKQLVRTPKAQTKQGVLVCLILEKQLPIPQESCFQ
jgi:hypothetical protein